LQSHPQAYPQASCHTGACQLPQCKLLILNDCFEGLGTTAGFVETAAVTSLNY
jgi:hypothetical protein